MAPGRPWGFVVPLEPGNQGYGADLWAPELRESKPGLLVNATAPELMPVSPHHFPLVLGWRLGPVCDITLLSSLNHV